MNRWESLTWDDLEAWAGGRSVSKGRTYQKQGRVEDLAISSDGQLLATVVGRERYVTSVALVSAGTAGNALRSNCTCPVGSDGCKHAVAVVAAYLNLLGEKEDVPEAEADDPRWDELQSDEADEDFDDDQIEERVEAVEGQAASSSRRRGQQNWDEKIKQHINAKSHDELAEMVWSLAQQFPELREEFRERIALGEGDVDRLVSQARKELHHVTAQEAWSNHWNDEGNLPDYTKLNNRLLRLVELGHPDTVAKMAGEILTRGLKQVNQSHDEGETVMQLAGCLEIVFDAVAKSSLPPVEKLLLAIDAQLQDDFDAVGESIGAVLEAGKRADWSIVADELTRRLSTPGAGHNVKQDDDEDEDDGYSRDYYRDRVSNWLLDALTKAGRDDELLVICEAEARKTDSYERLVALLIERGKYDDAARWAAEGIERTAEKLPGIALELARSLCELARRREQWDIVAAHTAWLFLQSPTAASFRELLTDAEKVKLYKPVHEQALGYLETGISPIRIASAKKGEPGKIVQSPAWPLPTPEYLMPIMKTDRHATRTAQPHHGVLIDIAIADKRPDEVLRWYDKMRAEQKHSNECRSWSGVGSYGDRVAEAVAESHPQRSLEIYLTRMNEKLKDASISAYETVASYLKKMKPIMQAADREGEWFGLIADVRLRHRNRPRLVEILERLEPRPIAAAGKRRR